MQSYMHIQILPPTRHVRSRQKKQNMLEVFDVPLQAVKPEI